jgi:hypothetical protein
VPQRLHDVTSPNSDHFQHVGQQTFMTTAHSQQWCGGHPVPRADGADTVTGSAQSGTDPGSCTTLAMDVALGSTAFSQLNRLLSPGGVEPNIVGG